MQARLTFGGDTDFIQTVVQKDVDAEGPTRAHLEIPEAARNPLMIQGDHGPVAFRNIYVRPLRPLIVR